MNKNKESGKFFATIQQVGKSFFLPVSVLPIAGLLLGLGSSFTNQTTIETYNLTGLLGSGTVLNGLLTIMSQVGTAIFGNLPLIFALAVALGMARKEKAVAVLSSGIAFIVMHTSINAMLKLSGYILPDGSQADFVLQGQLSSVLGITSLEMGVFGGIIVGLGVAALHNKFYKQELPMALSFFSGVRFVPIISTIVYIFVGILCFFVWPFVQSGIFTLGNLVTASGYAGTFIFGFLERALIPFGLHHVFYIPFWQTALGGTATIDGVVVAGAQNIFFAELASPNTVRFSVDACRFMSGKYSFMMAGLPAAAYAMYKCARPENKKVVAGLLFSAGLTSFLTGITEPIEFTFLFIAPVMFAVHSVLAASLATAQYLIGISGDFGSGIISNAALNWIPLGSAHWQQYLLSVVIGLVFSGIWFIVFKFIIEKFDFKTPGREDDDEEVKLVSKAEYKASKEDTSNDPTGNIEVKGGDAGKAAAFLAALGGKDNIESVTNCATRLRVSVKDETLVQPVGVFKKAGAHGLVAKGKAFQVIVGLTVPYVREEFEKLL